MAVSVLSLMYRKPWSNRKTHIAVVLCPQVIRTYLINYAAPFRFSTAMAFANVAAIEQSYDFQMSNEHTRRIVHLFDLSIYLQESLLANGYILMTECITRSPIIPVRMPNPRPLATWLKSQGFAVVPLTFPNVPRGTERLRICIHANNTREEADALVSALIRWSVQMSDSTQIPRREAKL